MNYTEMSKNELLKIAKDRDITGRHNMTKDELIVKLTVDNDEITPDVVKTIKRKPRSSARRDDEGKVIRKGVNLSGNSPYRRKYYYLDDRYANESDWSVEYRDSVNALPNQAKLILGWLRENQITDPEVALRGVEVLDQMKDSRYIATKIDSDKLFAYYRRLLDTVGLKEA